jgi:hypothetical protein
VASVRIKARNNFTAVARLYDPASRIRKSIMSIHSPYLKIRLAPLPVGIYQPLLKVVLILRLFVQPDETFYCFVLNIIPQLILFVKLLNCG